jgi:RNA polymerase sigma factor (sigma-70 family)
VQLKRIRNVIEGELTAPQREILLAYYFAQQTIPQIAKDRGVNKSTVCRTLHRAEDKLRKYLRY